MALEQNKVMNVPNPMRWYYSESSFYCRSLALHRSPLYRAKCGNRFSTFIGGSVPHTPGIISEKVSLHGLRMLTQRRR